MFSKIQCKWQVLGFYHVGYRSDQKQCETIKKAEADVNINTNFNRILLISIFIKEWQDGSAVKKYTISGRRLRVWENY